MPTGRQRQWAGRLGNVPSRVGEDGRGVAVDVHVGVVVDIFRERDRAGAIAVGIRDEDLGRIGIGARGAIPEPRVG